MTDHRGLHPGIEEYCRSLLDLTYKNRTSSNSPLGIAFVPPYASRGARREDTVGVGVEKPWGLGPLRRVETTIVTRKNSDGGAGSTSTEPVGVANLNRNKV